MDTLHHGMPATEGGVIDMPALVRALLKAALNEMMDEQADMACEGGANSRNGYRERGLVTPAGKITLRIPKLRCGTYFPDGMLERHGRVDRAMASAVAEMCANGVSTRKVERIAQKMGIDGLSSSQVSRICERLAAGVAALRAREFDVSMLYLFLDATYVECRREDRVQSTAVVTAIAVGEDGVRRVVELFAIDTETYAGWLGFCRDLHKRGVSGVKCVTSNARKGAAPRRRGVLPGRGVAVLHRSPGAQCMLDAVGQAPAQGRRQAHAGGVRAGGPRHGADGLPRRHRRDLVVFPGRWRAARGRRARRAGLPGLPRRAPPPHQDQQRPPIMRTCPRRAFRSLGVVCVLGGRWLNNNLAPRLPFS